jgi:uncharacterized protein (TIGR00251 family)
MIREDARGSVIEITVKPRAGRCRIAEASIEHIKIEVSSAPEGGKATGQAIKTLAQALDVAVTRLELLKGKTARQKIVLVRDLPAAECLKRLLESQD